MERWLRHLHNQPVTLADMGPALIRIWNNIPEVFFDTLIRSMRRVAKPASMKMMNTHATDFGNVQKTQCVSQNIYPMNSSDVKCYLSNYVMKNLTIYCTQ